MYQWFKVLEDLMITEWKPGEEITSNFKYVGLTNTRDAYVIDIATGRFEHKDIWWNINSDITPELIEVSNPKIIRKVHMREVFVPGHGTVTKMEHAKSIGYTATYDGKEKTITLVCYHDGTEPEFIIK